MALLTARSEYQQALPDCAWRRVASGTACHDNGDRAQSAEARGCAWYPSGDDSEGRFLAGTPSEPRHHKDTTPPLPLCKKRATRQGRQTQGRGARSAAELEGGRGQKPAPRWGFPHALPHASMVSAWFAPSQPPTCLSLFALYAYQVLSVHRARSMARTRRHEGNDFPLGVL